MDTAAVAMIKKKNRKQGKKLHGEGARQNAMESREARSQQKRKR